MIEIISTVVHLVTLGVMTVITCHVLKFNQFDRKKAGESERKSIAKELVEKAKRMEENEIYVSEKKEICEVLNKIAKELESEKYSGIT